MKTSEYKIHIVGAGISGLVAARVLEDHGYRPVIFEASDRAGGRVKTDVIDGYQLDHGFQVLLTAYPAAQKYLDYKALELQNFRPGAVIFKNGKQSIIGDPLRDLSLAGPTLFSRIGSVGDKLKILRLIKKLKASTIKQIFSRKETTTMEYLESFGFSARMIENFFKPFLSGIFLEPDLETSSRMFEFVYKMFGEGNAALPKAGIEAIPKQLAEALKNTEFRFNTSVTEVTDGRIAYGDSEMEKTDFIILATEASHLVGNQELKATSWKSCDTLYFETEKRVITSPLIGLIPDSDMLINNIFYHTSLKTDTSPEYDLLSVTVVKDHNLFENELIEPVTEELRELCGIEVKRFIKRYNIPRALPNLNDLRYDGLPEEFRLSPGVFLAGDVQLNGSLNAAMISGEMAAKGVMQAIEFGGEQ